MKFNNNDNSNDGDDPFDLKPQNKTQPVTKSNEGSTKTATIAKSATATKTIKPSDDNTVVSENTVTLTEEQQLVIDAVIQGKNVFFTGNAYFAVLAKILT